MLLVSDKIVEGNVQYRRLQLIVSVVRTHFIYFTSHKCHIQFKNGIPLSL